MNPAKEGPMPPFVPSQHFNIRWVKSSYGVSMLVTGKREHLMRLGEELTSLYGGRLLVLVLAEPMSPATLVLFCAESIPREAHELLEQRITEGFEVVIQTRQSFLPSYHFFFHPLASPA